MKSIPILIFALSVPFGAPNRPAAQDFSVDRFSTQPGGAIVSGGDFGLRGVLGEAVADFGALAGGDFSIASGVFLDPFAAPEPPSLAIQPQGARIRISWPIASSLFVLEESASVLGPWTKSLEDISTTPSEHVVTVPPTNGPRFFRLRQ